MSETSSFCALQSVIERCLPVEWGNDPVSDDSNCVVYRATDIDSDGHLSLEGGAERVVLSTKIAIKSLQPGDIILEASGGAPEKPVGRVALFKGPSRKPALTSNFFRAMRPKVHVDGQFLTYQLVALNRSSAIWRYQQQTTGLINLKVADYLKHPVWLPRLVTQRKIAAILTSLDAAIEKTEALIEKHQQIKAGLMRDLFTRGVLPSGQLRPSREQAPELYRETAAGWFPEDWSAETLESLLAPVANNIRSGPFGSALLKHELVENGIPFLGIDNIHVEEFRRDFKRFVSARKLRELSRYRVRPRDVIITIMGTVGRCCVVPDDLEIALSSKHLWTMTFDVERVIPELIGWQLNHAEWAKAWFRRCVQGGVMDAIQSSTLKTLKLPLPGIDEQRRIFARYEGAQSQVQRSRAQLTKLRQQKLGLMQDLLTGKVPVNVDAPVAEPADA